jgi:predicted acylesterase/phospholipase RssA
MFKVIKRAANAVRRRSDGSREAAPNRGSVVDADPRLLREVRLGLVMNGGVSLAVWIGGVTHEIDCIRRASGASERERERERTTAKYHELLKRLRERVIVDVIAGASAGGINGALLGAAVYAERPLPELRDVWITVGDFSKLLRSPSRSQPPSLLRGDDFVLPHIEQHFDDLLSRGGNGSIYLYITGTDYYGFPRKFADSTFRRFQELDHRRVFVFQHPPPDERGEIEAEAVDELERRPEEGSRDRGSTRKIDPAAMPRVGTFTRKGASRLLAEAARSSSSFPVAFEAHGMSLEGEQAQRWLIDGGVLDNQPFNPVLNRIATIAAGDLPVRRVLGYVVPYVTEVGTAPASGRDTKPEQPTAKQTASAASSLPRDLPKLVDRERVKAELSDGRRFDRARQRLNAIPARGLATLAETLFETYCDTRWDDCLETFAQWARPSFRPGAGEIGQLETLDLEQTLAEDWRASSPQPRVKGLRWIPDEREWDGGDQWHWGLSPSERIARSALARLRELLQDRPDDPELAEAKAAASHLVSDVRSLKFLTAERFRAVERGSVVERANDVYGRAARDLAEGFSELADRLERLQDREAAPPRLQHLIDAEVVQNAFIVSRIAPPAVFDFLHMSAGIRNALHHPDRTPETKLAGMKLNHFAGFLKRSWRANDWMWGRLDAAQYLVAAVLDQPHLDKLGPDDYSALARFAFSGDDDSTLAGAWKDTVGWARSRDYIDEDVAATVEEVLDELGNRPVQEQFVYLLARSREFRDRPRVSNALLDCCRAAIAAPIQLEILAEELHKIQAAVEDDLDAGASRGSSGADWARSHFEDAAAGRVAQFRRLRIGKDESPEDEASSKLGMDVASRGAAVAAAAFSGSHSGLPAAVRAPLASLRGLTLVFSIIVRLLVRTPPVGIAAVIAAAVAVVWALAQPNTILTAALPGIAAVAIGGVVVLLTMATSPLEARCRSLGQGVGLLLLWVVPLALLCCVFGLPFRLRHHLPGLQDVPLHLGGASDWLAGRVTRPAVDVAGSLTAAAFVAAIARLALGLVSRRLRVILLWSYRWLLLVAGGLIAGGAVYASVHGDSRNWNGVILFLILFGAISLAPLIAEVAAAGWWVLERVYGWVRARRAARRRRNLVTPERADTGTA